MDLDKQKVYPTDVEKVLHKLSRLEIIFDEFNLEIFQNKS